LEIDPGYVDVAIRRWEALTGKSATLATGETFEEIAEQRAIETLVPPAEVNSLQTGGHYAGAF
jgi:DNA modification methylase